MSANTQWAIYRTPSYMDMNWRGIREAYADTYNPVSTWGYFLSDLLPWRVFPWAKRCSKRADIFDLRRRLVLAPFHPKIVEALLEQKVFSNYKAQDLTPEFLDPSAEDDRIPLTKARSYRISEIYDSRDLCAQVLDIGPEFQDFPVKRVFANLYGDDTTHVADVHHTIAIGEVPREKV